MTADTVVSIRNVSKKYRLFHSQTDRLKEALHPLRRTYHTGFWALQDISLDVARGETVGILGRNGSGKSTLLQLISGVLWPTDGHIETHGRIAALLELGAGFNPDFTGRENAKLHGTMMGLSPTETERRLPDIERFANIGDFFDQPMRHYSSGMFIRVAFAAAIAVDPEVFIVDEALAVGDARFQAKCFAEVRRMQDAGVTILFVSHDQSMVSRLCERAVVLEQGELVFDGPTKDAINSYDRYIHGKVPVLSAAPSQASQGVTEPADGGTPTMKQFAESRADTVERFVHSEDRTEGASRRHGYVPDHFVSGDGRAALLDYLIVSEDSVDPVAVRHNSRLEILIRYLIKEDIEGAVFGLGVATLDGLLVSGSNTDLQGQEPLDLSAGSIVIMRHTFAPRFTNGKYLLNTGVSGQSEQTRTFAVLHRGFALLDVVSDRRCDGVTDFEHASQVLRQGA